MVHLRYIHHHQRSHLYTSINQHHKLHTYLYLIRRRHASPIRFPPILQAPHPRRTHNQPYLHIYPSIHLHNRSPPINTPSNLHNPSSTASQPHILNKASLILEQRSALFAAHAQHIPFQHLHPRHILLTRRSHLIQLPHPNNHDHSQRQIRFSVFVAVLPHQLYKCCAVLYIFIFNIYLIL